ncbi:DUF3037 domain-containing protein [Cytophaga hutchinsonii]|jgi:hypothetical protein|uniref:DUF3037 domain-containing protein n=1 Tax=Cytophaga hutchinsonii (strain ATCC 33406 / DSM 1761 / CIP 103989 / NBRC 15051 / NCIMB 9469 / D465) TaxID=269798 RepID=A0A6N4SSM5_CYTH3|nr:DUF3037 domain-containing protein [Cytophaga hutchinsonii]ABG59413.1 conserved hypothetical protein [Cytophaga hutchinsonii ATCC 33406]SFY01996.1 Protein of unknown function [Cytophaga hutchinsonii ATCC 33406]
MHAKNLFDYAVIRVMPKVEREEFINVGVIVFCKAEKFLQVKYLLDDKRLQAFSPDLDIDAVSKNLKAIEEICLGSKAGGAIGELDIASRFRWLTATRSTVIQSSKVHPGYTQDAAKTLEKLFAQLVL